MSQNCRSNEIPVKKIERTVSENMKEILFNLETKYQ